MDDTVDGVFESLFAADRTVRFHQQSAGVGAALGAVVGARRGPVAASVVGGLGGAAGFLLARAVLRERAASGGEDVLPATDGEGADAGDEDDDPVGIDVDDGEDDEADDGDEDAAE